MISNSFGFNSSGPERDHGDVLLLQLDAAVRCHAVAGRLADCIGHIEDELPAAVRRDVDNQSALVLHHDSANKQRDEKNMRREVLYINYAMFTSALLFTFVNVSTCCCFLRISWPSINFKKVFVQSWTFIINKSSFAIPESLFSFYTIVSTSFQFLEKDILLHRLDWH